MDFGITIYVFIVQWIDLRTTKRRKSKIWKCHVDNTFTILDQD